jgi:phage terminase large subunit
LSILADVPRKLVPLCNPARYKAAYGGRGGAKSHFFAEQVILLCRSRKTRVACIREVQATIKDSVRQLLIDKIQKLGLGNYFEVLESEIRAPNGSLIIFKGMQSYNAENIKSLEDFDIAWVEEAQTLSAHSLRLLRPTIRKAGSEIWFSWNPRHDTDAVDKFFRGGAKVENAIIVEVNWRDNPWFPDVLKDEMKQDFANDPEIAEHVWNGGYEIVSEAAYYSKLIYHAEQNGRIGHYPYDPTLPVVTAWDIGVDDYTAIWFIQETGYRATVIDYWEASGDGAEQIVRDCMPELNPDELEAAATFIELDREQSFTYEKHFLPHDVRVREWGAGARTRYITLKGLGVKPIHVGAPVGPQERINATRKVLPMMYFNDSKRVQLGISRLRRYSRKFNESMQTYTTPLHDENSHGADAFGEFAINCRIIPEVAGPQKPKADELEYVVRPDGVIAGNMSVRDAVEAMVKRRRNQ